MASGFVARLAGSALIALAFTLPAVATAAEEPAPVHGLAMLSEPKYPAGFTHFDYVNPDAPKGGTLVLASTNNAFDSLNPFILKGVPAEGVGLLFETLTAPSLDEPSSSYGLLAESMVVPPDQGWIAYNLRPEARWHDGRPVTPEDVVFSFETLKAKGRPFYAAYYANVAKAEKTGERQVRFTFTGEPNRELPHIMGQLTVLPKHYYEKVDFERASLEPPVGSGPYRVKRLEPGRTITYERVPDHWGRDLPVNRGRYNYAEVRYDNYRDLDVAIEAIKGGQFDLRFENSASRWATRYTGPAIDRGLLKTEKILIAPPARMQGWVFNLRRAKFQDRRVRAALAYAFDWEWTRKNLTYNQYTRIGSYFEGDKELMATGLPGPKELALLEPLRDKVPPEVFTQVYAPPRTDGSGNIRDNLRQGFALFKEAGWEIKDGVMTSQATGERMEFEILSDSPADERVNAPFIQNLQRLGVRATLRIVDQAQYQQRNDSHDYDAITDIWGQSDNPGNEQRDYWGSAAADTSGSLNTVGIKDPAVDALVDKIIYAPTREDLEVACRALDRVLLWNHYVLPQFTDDAYKVAYWDKFGRPAVQPTEAPDLYAWWIDPAKEAALSGAKPEVTGAAAAAPKP